jgi:hypothetical protein
MNGFTNIAMAEQRQAELLATAHRVHADRPSRARRLRVWTRRPDRQTDEGRLAPVVLGPTPAPAVTSPSSRCA